MARVGGIGRALGGLIEPRSGTGLAPQRAATAAESHTSGANKAAVGMVGFATVGTTYTAGGPGAAVVGQSEIGLGDVVGSSDATLTAVAGGCWVGRKLYRVG